MLLALFAAAKWDALRRPYFWDELGAYSQAALCLHDRGPTLLPGAVPPDLSRGHPLLYSFLVSLAFRVFGPTVVTGHAFNLVVALAAIAAVYFFGRRYFSAAAGLAAACVFALQPVFVAQSVMVLPEVMLCLFALLAFYFYFARRFWAYFACASAALLTKETGLIVPAVLSLVALVEEIRARRLSPGGRPSARAVWKRAAAPLAPVAMLAAFLVVQRLQNGWFLFPLHASLISLNPADLASRLYRGVHFLFVDQGRAWLVLLAIAAAACGRIARLAPEEKRVAAALGVFIVAMILFSAMNYHMNRYYLLVMPAFALLSARLFWSGAIMPRRGRIVCAALCLAGTAPFMFVFWRANFDVDLSYRIPLDTLQRAVEFVERETAGEENVRICAGFPAADALRDPRQGYISERRYLPAAAAEDADFLIETLPGEAPARPAALKLRLVFTCFSFYSRAAVYRVEGRPIASQ